MDNHSLPDRARDVNTLLSLGRQLDRLTATVRFADAAANAGRAALAALDERDPRLHSVAERTATAIRAGIEGRRLLHETEAVFSATREALDRDTIRRRHARLDRLLAWAATGHRRAPRRAGRRHRTRRRASTRALADDGEPASPIGGAA